MKGSRRKCYINLASKEKGAISKQSSRAKAKLFSDRQNKTKRIQVQSKDSDKKKDFQGKK